MKPLFKKNFGLLFCIAITQVLTSCYSYKPLVSDGGQSLVSKIEVGEHYQFTMTDKGKFRMKVSGVDSTTVFGVFFRNGHKANTFIKYEKIEGIEKRKVNVGKTVGISLACTVLIPVLFVVLFPPHITFNFGGHI